MSDNYCWIGFFYFEQEQRSSFTLHKNNGLLLRWTRTTVFFYFEQEQRSSFTLNKNNGLFFLWTRTTVFFYFEQEQRSSFTNNYFSPQLI
jgi:predicted cupin superfamily sugar epimerase